MSFIINPYLFKIIKLFLFFIIIFSAVFIFFNWPALKDRFFYSENENFIFEEEKKNSADFNEENKSSAFGNALDKKAEEILKDDRLIIKKINVSVPIISISFRQDKILQEGLKKGAVIFPQTALPGEKGNCVIVGHSSNFSWRKGDYDTIFVLLDKIEIGDEVEIFWKEEKIKYVIFENPQIVKADQTEILASAKEPILTLMTCWPIGTNYKRLIVKGKLVK
jgi:LPXTG-site transpeptidase (sortase) family protein